MPRLSQNKDLPTAITQLKLCLALKKCGKMGVENAFDMSEDEKLYVYDDAKLGHSDWINNEHTDLSLSETFKVQNPDKNTLVLLPLDGCIITGKNYIKGGVCDCALLTDKALSFVEFKTNVSSSTNNLTVLQRANEAEEQLWHTFNGIVESECHKIGIDINQRVLVDFFIVFNNDLQVTGVRADLQDLQSEFLMNKHYPLYFENSKQFR